MQCRPDDLRGFRSPGEHDFLGHDRRDHHPHRTSFTSYRDELGAGLPALPKGMRHGLQSLRLACLSVGIGGIGSATAETGWLGQHLLMEDADGFLRGALACYVKSHSQGEYVFDHGWADAFERAGGRYYPKLQCSVPFTPATGPRLLVAGGCDPRTVRDALAAGLKELTRRHRLSSAHVTFVPTDEMPILEQAGFLHRMDQQFHFMNEGYGSHDDFLATLTSRKRKALKKERRSAVENGITIDWLTGSDLTEAIWDQFLPSTMEYRRTKWGRPYLTRAFYSLIGERMADDILLVMASAAGAIIAGAINFIGGDALYGRHWGCIEDHPFLHFEVCYHQAIDYAIAKGLKRGRSRRARRAQACTGLHAGDDSFRTFHQPSGAWRAPVADYLERERRDVEETGEFSCGTRSFPQR